MIDKQKRDELRAALKDPCSTRVVGWINGEPVSLEPDDLLELLDAHERLEAEAARGDFYNSLVTGIVAGTISAAEKEPGE